MDYFQLQIDLAQENNIIFERILLDKNTDTLEHIDTERMDSLDTTEEPDDSDSESREMPPAVPPPPPAPGTLGSMSAVSSEGSGKFKWKTALDDVKKIEFDKVGSLSDISQVDWAEMSVYEKSEGRYVYFVQVGNDVVILKAGGDDSADAILANYIAFCIGIKAPFIRIIDGGSYDLDELPEESFIVSD
eukprot:TRINITY_DN4356_c0_g1_i1.p2 TRINITY_DN4356_c0_g1~~TRINITY_DN4356_c0_g1_i1.p2  ORF type:complete len:199 (+),score=48.60 TRINITY_DN4356_c0_g1_i1:32-598(+)